MSSQFEGFRTWAKVICQGKRKWGIKTMSTLHMTRRIKMMSALMLITLFFVFNVHGATKQISSESKKGELTLEQIKEIEARAGISEFKPSTPSKKIKLCKEGYYKPNVFKPFSMNINHYIKDKQGNILHDRKGNPLTYELESQSVFHFTYAGEGEGCYQEEKAHRAQAVSSDSFYDLMRADRDVLAYGKNHEFPLRDANGKVIGYVCGPPIYPRGATKLIDYLMAPPNSPGDPVLEKLNRPYLLKNELDSEISSCEHYVYAKYPNTNVWLDALADAHGDWLKVLEFATFPCPADGSTDGRLAHLGSNGLLGAHGLMNDESPEAHLFNEFALSRATKSIANNPFIELSKRAAQCDLSTDGLIDSKQAAGEEFSHLENWAWYSWGTKSARFRKLTNESFDSHRNLRLALVDLLANRAVMENLRDGEKPGLWLTKTLEYYQKTDQLCLGPICVHFGTELSPVELKPYCEDLETCWVRGARGSEKALMYMWELLTEKEQEQVRLVVERGIDQVLASATVPDESSSEEPAEGVVNNTAKEALVANLNYIFSEVDANLQVVYDDAAKEGCFQPGFKDNGSFLCSWMPERFIESVKKDIVNKKFTPQKALSMFCRSTEPNSEERAACVERYTTNLFGAMNESYYRCKDNLPPSPRELCQREDMSVQCGWASPDPWDILKNNPNHRFLPKMFPCKGDVPNSFKGNVQCHLRSCRGNQYQHLQCDQNMFAEPADESILIEDVDLFNFDDRSLKPGGGNSQSYFTFEEAKIRKIAHPCEKGIPLWNTKNLKQSSDIEGAIWIEDLDHNFGDVDSVNRYDAPYECEVETVSCEVEGEKILQSKGLTCENKESLFDDVDYNRNVRQFETYLYHNEVYLDYLIGLKKYKIKQETGRIRGGFEIKHVNECVNWSVSNGTQPVCREEKTLDFLVFEQSDFGGHEYGNSEFNANYGYAWGAGTSGFEHIRDLYHELEKGDIYNSVQQLSNITRALEGFEYGENEQGFFNILAKDMCEKMEKYKGPNDLDLFELAFFEHYKATCKANGRACVENPLSVVNRNTDFINTMKSDCPSTLKRVATIKKGENVSAYYGLTCKADLFNQTLSDEVLAEDADGCASKVILTEGLKAFGMDYREFLLKDCMNKKDFSSKKTCLAERNIHLPCNSEIECQKLKDGLALNAYMYGYFGAGAVLFGNDVTLAGNSRQTNLPKLWEQYIHSINDVCVDGLEGAFNKTMDEIDAVIIEKTGTSSCTTDQWVTNLVDLQNPEILRAVGQVLDTYNAGMSIGEILKEMSNAISEDDKSKHSTFHQTISAAHGIISEVVKRAYDCISTTYTSDESIGGLSTLVNKKINENFNSWRLDCQKAITGAANSQERSTSNLFEAVGYLKLNPDVPIEKPSGLGDSKSWENKINDFYEDDLNDNGHYKFHIFALGSYLLKFDESTGSDSTLSKVAEGGVKSLKESMKSAAKKCDEDRDECEQGMIDPKNIDEQAIVKNDEFDTFDRFGEVGDDITLVSWEKTIGLGPVSVQLRAGAFLKMNASFAMTFGDPLGMAETDVGGISLEMPFGRFSKMDIRVNTPVTLWAKAEASATIELLIASAWVKLTADIELLKLNLPFHGGYRLHFDNATHEPVLDLNCQLKAVAELIPRDRVTLEVGASFGPFSWEDDWSVPFLSAILPTMRQEYTIFDLPPELSTIRLKELGYYF